MRLLKTQDESEFERNVLRHLDASYNLARWLLGNPHDAEDVVQDSAVRAYTSYKSFRGSDAKAWFLAIVRNGCMNRLRQRSAHITMDLSAEEAKLVDERPSPEQLAIRVWEAEVLQKAIDALSIGYREMIILRELEGLSYKEIATVTELPIGTVMSRLARARSCLQRELCEARGETQ